MDISLDALLAARDTRRETQLQLLERYPGGVPVVLTVNIPGSEKRTPQSVAIGHEGMRSLLEALPVAPCETFVRDLPTGFEGYAVIEGLSPDRIKELTVSIESSHPLGRLMDIDVISSDGTPISRSITDDKPRKCLICEDDARTCMRLRRHSIAELTDVINRLHDDFFHTV